MLFDLKLGFNIIHRESFDSELAARFDVCAAHTALERYDVRADYLKSVAALQNDRLLPIDGGVSVIVCCADAHCRRVVGIALVERGAADRQLKMRPLTG